MENETLNIIYNKFKNSRMPHAILINTNNITKAKKDLKILLKKIICLKEYKENCNEDCHICYQIENNLIPNIIEISPIKMNIERQQIFDLKEKFLAKPLYLDYNIYIINCCETLNFKSSTTLLKFLEEPEERILGFYLTENIEKVLPTIRSRCEIFNVLYENEINNDDEETKEIVSKYLQYIKENSNISFVYTDVFEPSNLERKDYAKIFKYLLKELEKRLTNTCQNNLIKELKYKKIIELMELVKQVIMDIESNVNIELCIMLFSKELRKYYE